MKEILIPKSLSQKVLMVSVIYKTSGPAGGGVSSVLQSYSEYIENMRHGIFYIIMYGSGCCLYLIEE